MNTKVHREEILLAASPATIRDFIKTPERMMDYYPGGISCGVFEVGQSYYCHGKAGVSLIEILPEQQPETATHCVTLKVTTARGLCPPFTVEAIRGAAFFSMFEDWELYPHGDGTRLVKTWRDIHKVQLRWLPLGWIVKRTAKSESETLRNAWDRAAGL